ncbi:hypothetical protein V6N11_042057 [Hibiscus sabdariffa]|uniref:Uncharacterized protein n=1 Tax=Hibiscus sabdariffa TaxID=183260 RepID=A0ABR2QV55_9ROSI
MERPSRLNQFLFLHRRLPIGLTHRPSYKRNLNFKFSITVIINGLIDIPAVLIGLQLIFSTLISRVLSVAAATSSLSPPPPATGTASAASSISPTPAATTCASSSISPPSAATICASSSISPTFSMQLFITMHVES